MGQIITIRYKGGVASDLSTVNEYDNFLLILPDKPRTVVVRHYYISGNVIHEKIDSKGNEYYGNETAKVGHKVTPG